MPQTRRKSGPSPWHPEDIKAAVRKGFGSMAELARQNHVSESVVQTAVSRVQPTGNRIIAAALGMSVHEIWPQWFDAAGNPIADEVKRRPGKERQARLKGVAA